MQATAVLKQSTADIAEMPKHEVFFIFYLFIYKLIYIYKQLYNNILIIIIIIIIIIGIKSII